MKKTAFGMRANHCKDVEDAELYKSLIVESLKEMQNVKRNFQTKLIARSSLYSLIHAFLFLLEKFDSILIVAVTSQSPNLVVFSTAL